MEVVGMSVNTNKNNNLISSLSNNIIDKTTNDWADCWFYDIGVNVIPFDSKNKQTFIPWSQYQNNSIPDDIFEQWKNNSEFKNGIAIITGRIWRGSNKNQYIIGIDCDNKKAIEEICTRDGKTITIQDLAKWTIVEQHPDDPDKAHIYIRSTKPFKKKSSDKVNSGLVEKIGKDEIPAIEVKGSGEHGVMIVSPSIHKNGHQYTILGTDEPVLCDKFELHIDNICKKYEISYLESNNDIKKNNVPIEDLFKSETRIYEGHNRHEAILRVMESLLQRNKDIMTLEEIKEHVKKINQRLCVLPLNNSEFNKQWRCALNYITRKNNKKDYNNKIENDNDSNIGTHNNNSEEIDYLELVKKHIIELFTDQYNSPYVVVQIKNHTEILSLNGTRCRNLLYKLCYDETKKISSEKIENIIRILKADAEFNGKKKKLDLRVAKTIDSNGNTSYYYDLTNKEWEVIKLTENSWSVIKNNVPILFRRYSNQEEQVNPIAISYPEEKNIFDKFMDILNVRNEEDRLLLKCYIVSLFIPEIAKPILMPYGEQGSAKSTLQELIKILVDPSSLKTLSFPKDVNELIQQLSHSYVVYYDNISYIKEWISDVLCRAVTGSGFSKRQLYTDDDDIIYNFKRCIGFNGINLEATKADLLERGILIQLERISKKQRRKIDDVWKDFELLKPKLLGYIFDILIRVLQVKKQLGNKNLLGEYNRMADFEEYGEIISRCMGYPENEFLQIYQENINIQIEEAIEASPLSTTVYNFVMFNKDPDYVWENTATELLSELNNFSSVVLQIDTFRAPSWPKSASQLSRRLNGIKTNLREKGIIIDKFKNKEGAKVIRISKVQSTSSYRPEFQN